MQKQYGKSQSELETLVDGFAWVLADYGMDEIALGFAEYIKSNSDIPAPADIKKIIDSSRYYASIEEPDIETLRRYQERGIQLTPRQQAMIDGAQ